MASGTTNPFDQIIIFLQSQKINFQIFAHQPVYTCAEAAAARGGSEALVKGVKSLLLKTGSEFVLAVIPADKRLDSKKVKQAFAVKDYHFADPEDVEKIMGCQIGACHPFGNLIKVRTIVDPLILEKPIITFNPGKHTISLEMSGSDLQKCLQPAVNSLCK